ncbi:MAG: hypothetical protein ACYC6F_18420 [Longimicrobiales bacterium]
MADQHESIDAALAEIERVRKFLARLKVPQIRNAEHRDFLKATALSWFRGHRLVVAGTLRPELLATIDGYYRAILDATERASARTTFVSAAKGAKDSLVQARSEALLAAPSARTGDAAPSFASLASDQAMQAILARRWEECRRCLDADAPLAATVMMGGLLEALFVARANRLGDKTKLFSAKSTPLDPKTKKALDLRQWMLGPYIDVGHELRWISRSGKDVAAVLRDYRNYVHPEKERSHGVVLSRDDAAMLWEITKTLSKELLALKGVT